MPISPIINKFDLFPNKYIWIRDGDFLYKDLQSRIQKMKIKKKKKNVLGRFSSFFFVVFWHFSKCIYKTPPILFCS